MSEKCEDLSSSLDAPPVFQSPSSHGVTGPAGEPARELGLAGSTPARPFSGEHRARNTVGAMEWTDEEIALLKDGIDRGESRAFIAMQLGRSRNAITGKCDRLGINTPYVRRATPARTGKAFANVVRRVNGESYKPPAPVHPWRPAASMVRYGKPEMMDKPLPDAIQAHDPATACVLLDLTNETCRYPIGPLLDPPGLFCGSPGANLAAGMPYCSGCARIAYRPAGSR